MINFKKEFYLSHCLSLLSIIYLFLYLVFSIYIFFLFFADNNFISLSVFNFHVYLQFDLPFISTSFFLNFLGSFFMPLFFSFLNISLTLFIFFSLLSPSPFKKFLSFFFSFCVCLCVCVRLGGD